LLFLSLNVDIFAGHYLFYCCIYSIVLIQPLGCHIIKPVSCDAMLVWVYVMAIPSVCLCICLCVTRMLCINYHLITGAWHCKHVTRSPTEAALASGSSKSRVEVGMSSALVVCWTRTNVSGF